MRGHKSKYQERENMISEINFIKKEINESTKIENKSK